MDSFSRASSLEMTGPIVALIIAAMPVGSGVVSFVGVDTMMLTSPSDGLWEGCLGLRPLRVEVVVEEGGATGTLGVRFAVREGFLRTTRSGWGSSTRVRPSCVAAFISCALHDSATAHQMSPSNSFDRSLI